VDFTIKESNQQLAGVLRQHRIEKKMSVEDVSGKTGIPALHIISIEEGAFEQFDSFYLKMYLKKYGAFLGIGMDALYAQFYGDTVGETAPKETPEPIKKAVSKPNSLAAVNKRAPRKEEVGKVIGIACLAIVAAFGVYFLWDMVSQGMSGEPQQEIQNPNTDINLGDGQEEEGAGLGEEDGKEESGAAEAPDEVQPVTTITEEESPANQQVFSIVTTEEAAVLTLTFSGTTWLGTNNGIVIPFESQELTGAGFTRNDGDVETVSIVESTSLYLNIPNLHLIELAVNGEAVPLGTTPRHQQITLNITIE